MKTVDQKQGPNKMVSRERFIETMVQKGEARILKEATRRQVELISL